MVFHEVVEECVCIFDHKVCAPRSKTLPFTIEQVTFAHCLFLCI